MPCTAEEKYENKMLHVVLAEKLVQILVTGLSFNLRPYKQDRFFFVQKQVSVVQ